MLTSTPLVRNAVRALALSLAGSVCYAASVVAVNFTGPSLSDIAPIAGGAFAPSDMGGAAGPNHVVQFINGGFTVYNKTGGVVAGTISDTAFWTNAGISAATTNVGLSDTRIIYDTDSQRWFATEINVSDTGNKILVARSNSSDPTSGFKAVEFVANTRSGNFGDQPTLGIDKNGVYIGVTNFTPTGNYANTVSLFSIPKSDLIASTPSLTNLSRFEDRSASARGFEPDPVVNLNGTGGHVLAIDNDAFGLVDRTNINGASGPGATLSTTTKIGIAYDSSPGYGAQPDGTRQIDAGDDRINSSVYEANGYIYAAHTVGEKNGSSNNIHALIDWMIIDAQTGALKAEGLLTAPNFDFYYGSIAANANGDFVIAYNRSGDSTTGPAGNISGYADVCHFDGSNANCETPLLLSQGAVSNYHLFGGLGERWGDYSAASIDPLDSNSFWVFTGVVRAPVGRLTSNWGTQISEITIGAVTATPEPSTFALVIGSAAFLAFKKRKQRSL